MYIFVKIVQFLKLNILYLAFLVFWNIYFHFNLTFLFLSRILNKDVKLSLAVKKKKRKYMSTLLVYHKQESYAVFPHRLFSQVLISYLPLPLSPLQEISRLIKINQVYHPSKDAFCDRCFLIIRVKIVNVLTDAEGLVYECMAKLSCGDD